MCGLDDCLSLDVKRPNLVTNLPSDVMLPKCLVRTSVAAQQLIYRYELKHPNRHQVNIFNMKSVLLGKKPMDPEVSRCVQLKLIL